MSPFVIPLIVLGVAFAIALLRAAIGPSLVDRAVAAEVCFIILVSGVALLAVGLGSTHFLDVVVVGVLFQFIATVSLGRLLERKERP